MKHEIRVSRHGFTECPACLAHIRIEAEWSRTTCPFCHASLLGATREGPRDLMTVLRSVHARTGGALAASLLSFGLATGCEETGLELTAPPRDGGPAQERDAGELADGGGFDVPDSGVVPDAGVVDAGDMVPSPEYGLPPMDAGVTDAQVVDAGDTPVTPLYGKAPLDAGVADAATITDAGDTPVTPHYGLPPQLDGGLTRLDAGVEDGGE